MVRMKLTDDEEGTELGADPRDSDPGNGSVSRQDQIKEDLSRQQALKEFETLQLEWRAIATDTSPAGKSRRAELARKIRDFDLTRINGPVVRVEIDVPLDHQGFEFHINEKPYHGRVTVTADEAQVLLHMIDANRRAGLRVFTKRGEDRYLGTVGDSARMAEIQAED